MYKCVACSFIRISFLQKLYFIYILKHHIQAH